MQHLASRMKMRARAVAAVVVLSTAALSATGTTAQAASPPYLTLMMGRAIDAQALDTPVPDDRTGQRDTLDDGRKNGRRYMLPGQLDASVATSSNAWTAIQYYRLVTGSQGTAATPAGLPAWDC